jgi:predicted alpha/beta hydrolase family esterase
MMRRGFLLFALALVLLVVVAAASTVMIIEGHLVYGAQGYPAGTSAHLPAGIVRLDFRTGQGHQVAFYRPPTNALAPERIWLVCYGNGNLALDWVGEVAAAPDPAAGWLLLEYPGFGLCEGHSSPQNILDSSAAAVEALRKHLTMSEDALRARLGVLGHSLGTATALQYAAAYPVQRIVLIAPFTTLADIGDELYGWPFGRLLVHRFDNGARLDEIAQQHPRPAVLMVHGGNDDCIPPAMSLRLALAHPGWIERTVIAAADHDTVVHATMALLTPWARTATAH